MSIESADSDAERSIRTLHDEIIIPAPALLDRRLALRPRIAGGTVHCLCQVAILY
jgi:hypothetical protein